MQNFMILHGTVRKRIGASIFIVLYRNLATSDITI